MSNGRHNVSMPIIRKTEVIWIDGGSNPADAMTKIHPCQVLRDLIDSNTISLKAAGWVERAEGEMVIKGT